MSSFRAILLLLGALWATASRYQVVSPQNQKRLIQLKSQFDIDPGGFQSLNIDVPEEYLSIYGRMPPKLVSISSLNEDGIYGDGDLVILTLEFADNVNVTGVPTLTLNTGCMSEDCIVKEIQSFRCAADYGSFALKLENQYIMSIHSNATQDQFKYKLETLEGVEEVTIQYGNLSSDNTMLNELCTSDGNEITITFESTSFPQYDGDVPSLEFDPYNWYPDPRTLKHQGNVDERLKGIHKGYIVELSETATEIQKGKNQRNSLAYYSSGSGTTTLEFQYQVRVGDDSESLDVVSINFDDGFIFSPITGANVSTNLPPLGKSFRYMDSSPSSLSYNRDFVITASEPKVLLVTSPNDDAIYTRGDTIYIHVVFDIPIKYYGSEIYLLLKPGELFRRAYIEGLSDDLQRMIFKYDVSAGDVSDDLDYRNAESIVLNGGSIFRYSEGNLSAADITLPEPGAAGSLSQEKDIVIDTNSPLVLDFVMNSTDGVYTAGDDVDLLARFDFPVQVIGTPVIWVRNEVRTLNNAHILYAPFGQYSEYAPPKPGGAATLTFQFSFNWELFKNDEIVISLPRFTGSDNNGLYIGSIGLGDLFDGSWVESEGALTLSLQNATLAPLTAITVQIEAASGISLSPYGVLSPSSSLYFSVHSKLFNTTYIDFAEVEAIALSSVSLSISPANTEVAVQLHITFSVPNVLVEGDHLVFELPGFTLPSGVSDTASNDIFAYRWDQNSSTLQIDVSTNTTDLLFDVSLDDLSLVSPKSGVNDNSVFLSTDFLFGGVITSMPVESITHICSDPDAKVQFLGDHSGSPSQLQVNFTVGIDSLLPGDEIVVSLPQGANLIEPSGVSRDVAILKGENTVFWSASVLYNDITLTVLDNIEAQTFIALTFDESAGISVPSGGIRKNLDTYSVHIASSKCSMTNPIKYNFTSGILHVNGARANFSETVVTSETIGIDIQFYLDESLLSGDVIYLALPNFFRPEDADPIDNITSSTVPVYARYNRFHKRMEFVLSAGYSPTSGVPFRLSIPPSPGFFLPPSGMLSVDHSISLSVLSENGQSLNMAMAHPCIGFCNISADYYPRLTWEPLSISMTVLFSENLRTGEELILSFVGLSKIENKDIIATITPSSAQSSVASTSWDSVDNTLTVTVPSFNSLTSPYSSLYVIPKLDIIGLDIVGFEFTNISGSIDVSVSNSLASVNGTVSANVPFPATVYQGPGITSSFVSFLPNSNGDIVDEATSYNVTFSFFMLQNAVNGSYLNIYLPDFDLTSAGVIEATNVLEDQYLWIISPEDSMLTIRMLDTILAPLWLNITSGSIDVPFRGVAEDLSSVHFAVGYADVLSNDIAFTSVQSVSVVHDAIVTISAFQNENLVLQNGLTVTWWSNFNLTSSSSVEIAIPGIIGSDQVVLLRSNSSFVSHFYSINSTMRLTAMETIPRGNISLTVSAPPGAELLVDPSGIQAESRGYITVSSALNHHQPGASVALPCVGVCSMLLVADVSKSSFSSAYTLSVSFSDPLLFGDEIVLYLDGFTKDSEAGEVIEHESISFYVYWNKTTSTLTMLVSNVASAGASQIDLTLSRDLLLRLPAEGIKDNENKFNASWTSGAIGAIIFGDILEVKPVNKLVQSSLIVSPRKAGFSAVVSIVLSFSNELSPGDIIDISFPNYGFPDGLIALSGPSSDYFEGRTISMNPVSGISTLLLTCISMPSPASGLNISFSGVTLPVDGIPEGLISTVSVESDAKASMSTQSILNYTHVGAFKDSFIGVSYNRTSDAISVSVTFDAQCSMEAGESIRVAVPAVTSLSDSALNVTVNDCSNCATAVWLSDSSAISVTLQHNLTLGGNIFSFSSPNWKTNEGIFYPNDEAFYFSVESEYCGADSTSFVTSSAVGIVSSEISFGNPVAGEASSLMFNIQPKDGLLEGDLLSFILPGFTSTDGVSPEVLSIGGPGKDNLGNMTWSYDVIFQGINLHVPIVYPVDPQQNLVFNISASNMLALPANGINASDAITVTVVYPEVQKNITGLFLMVQPVGHFYEKQCIVSSLLPGVSTSVEFLFALSGEILVGETVSFYIPGFAKQSSSLWLSGLEPFMMTLSWDVSQSRVVFTALEVIPALSSVNATVFGLRTPLLGISKLESILFTATSGAAAAPVDGEIMNFVSTIPHSPFSSVSFMSAEPSSLDYFEDSSVKNNSILLFPGHELNSEDIGSTVSIEDVWYTIKNVELNVVTFEEEYNGTLVFQGSPSLELYTPDARPAYYVKGSMGTELLFRYRVSRGDVSNGLKIHNMTSSSHITSPFELFGSDQVLRVSNNPLVPFSQLLPSFEGGSNVYVDSIRPVVLGIDSSTADGTYVAGQNIDFRITFSYPVSVNTTPGQSPALLLRKSNGGIAIARYHSGTTTDQLYFYYVVDADDMELWDSDLITVGEESSIVQPLRVIMSNKFQFIRRDAIDPVIDAYPSIPISGLNISTNISWIGDGVYVSKVWAEVSDFRENNIYSAGDMVLVYVTFSDKVKVVSGDDSIMLSEQLSILLDVGKASLLPGRAKFANATDAYTLMFTYELSEEDLLEDELRLACTCQDLFGRTFIELNNGSSVVEDSSRAYPVSTMLAASNEQSNLLLLSPFVVENSRPVVIGVSSNSTAGIYSPGAAILLSIHFDHPVCTIGMTRLFLIGDKTNCVAHYFSGNNSNTLNYLYLASYYSKTSTLSCRYTDSLDLEYGKILRYSQSPVIPANTELPLPGSVYSVGIRSKIAIDSTDAKLDQMYTSKVKNDMAVLPLLELDIHMLRQELLHLVYLHNLESAPAVLDNSSSINDIMLLLSSVISEPLDFHSIEVLDSTYSAISFRNADQSSFSFVPEITSTDSQSIFFHQKQWWSSYSVGGVLGLSLQYDRRVVAENVYLPLNTGSSLNHAKSDIETHEWNLHVDLRDLDSAELNILQDQFQLRYGGWTSSCISIGGALDGVMSFQAKLEEIPPLRMLGIAVKRQDSSSDYLVFKITSKRAALHDLELARSFSSCLSPIAMARLRIEGSGRLNMQYNIRPYGSVVLRSNSTVPAGKYSFQVLAESGVYVSPLGSEGFDIVMEHLDQMGFHISRRTVEMSAISRVGHSSLSFSTASPGSSTFVRAVFSLESSLLPGDVVTIFIPGITNSTPISPIEINEGCCSVEWDSEREALVYTVTNATASYASLSLSTDTTFGLSLPNHGVFDHKYFRFSVNGSLASVPPTQFQVVDGFSLTRFAVFVRSPIPRYFSDIDVEFSVELTLDPGSCIYFVLPGYRIADDRWTDFSEEIRRQVSIGVPNIEIETETEVPLFLSGSFQHAFTGAFLNSSMFVLRPVLPLLPGRYSVTILKSSHIIVGSPTTFPAENPPVVWVEGPSWNMSASDVLEFTKVLGLEDSCVSFSLERPSDVVINFSFRFNVSYDLSGPVEIELKVPSLTNIKRQEAWQLDSNTSLTWSESDQSFYYKSGYGVSNASGFSFALSSEQLENFRMSPQGQPHIDEYHGADLNSSNQMVRFSIWCPDGTLPMTPIHSVTAAPSVLHSSLAYSSADVFSSSSSITIDLKLNMRASNGDNFTFVLYETPFVNVNSSVQLSGPSASCSSVSYITENRTLKISITNESHHCTSDGLTSYQWMIPSEFGLGRTIGVVQADFDVFTMEWENAHTSTGGLPVLVAPIGPFLTSSLAFASPYAGAATSVTIRLISTTQLQQGDEISFVLPYYSFNIGADVSISDADGVEWEVLWSDGEDILTMICPRSFQATSFDFLLSGEAAATLPDFDNVALSNPSIYLTRGDNSLVPQLIPSVQSIGGIDDNSSLVVFEISDAMDVTIAVHLALVRMLDIGDTVTLHLKNFLISYDTTVDVFDEDWNLSHDFTAWAESETSHIVIQSTSIANIANVTLFLRSVSQVLSISSQTCSLENIQLNCSVEIEVDSQSCSVPLTTVPTHFVLPFVYAGIQLRENDRGAVAGLSATSTTPLDTNSDETDISPTGAPTSEPSSIPTSAPTATPTTTPINHTYVQVFLDLRSQFSLSAGTVVYIHAPHMSSSDDVHSNITVHDGASLQELDNFAAYWNDTDSVIEIVVKDNVDAGALKLLVQFPQFYIKKVALYENDASIRYGLSYFHLNVFPLPFDSVAPIGLRMSRMALSDVVSGGKSVITLDVHPVLPFSRNNSIDVLLPGFRGQSGSLSFENLNTSSCPNLDGIVWDNTTSTAYVNFLDASIHHCQKMTAKIFSNDTFRMSSFGTNRAVGTPKISVLDNDILVVSPSFFKEFDAVVEVFNASITFVDEHPTSAYGVSMQFNFSVGSSVHEGDYFDIFLPQYWSTEQNTIAVSCFNTSDLHEYFLSSWEACSDTLRFQVTSNSSIVDHCVVVLGLRLPLFGVTNDIIGAMSISAQLSEGFVPPAAFEHAPLVGHVISSSVSFSAPNLTSSVGVSLGFKLAMPLYIGETVDFTLPSLQAESGVSIFSSSLNANSVSCFSVSWIAAEEVLSLTASIDILANADISIEVGHTSSSNGFWLPQAGLDSHDSLGFVMASSAREGPVSGVIVQHVEKVGIIESDLYYEIYDLSMPMEIHAHLRFSEVLTSGDEIVVFCPCVTGASNQSLQVLGGSGESFFRPAATVSFDNATKELRMQFTEDVPAGADIDIIVSTSNSLYVSEAGTSNQTHYIYGNASFVGSFVPREMHYSPSDIVGISIDAHSVQCDVGGIEASQNCTLNFDIELHSQLASDTFLAVSHKNLHVRDERDFKLVGDITSYFDSFWRPADNVARLGATAELSIVDNGYLLSDADYDYHPVQNESPILTNNVAIEGNIPHVVDVFSSSMSNLVCGDAILIVVVFSEEVMFDESSSEPLSLYDVKLLLNTNEYARYYDGNATNSFRFIYHVESPALNISNLGLLGPDALEFGNSLIHRVSQKNIAINPSIPQPYGDLLRHSSDESAISVDCSRQVSIVNVSICHKPFSSVPQYIQPGDIVDICVEFERAIQVVGEEPPMFIFDKKADLDLEDEALFASFVNVSSEQWIHVKGGDNISYSLQYEGHYTECLAWKNVSGLLDELAAIPFLEPALPLYVDSYPTPNGYKHKLVFGGVAPAPLSVAHQRCPLESRATSIQLPSESLRTLSFRRVILPNDPFQSMRLAANSTDAIVVPSPSDIYVVTHTTGISKPSLMIAIGVDEMGSLSNNTADVIVYSSTSQVRRVYSSFSDIGIAGDVVSIIVEFESPVVASGNPYLNVHVDGIARRCDLCAQPADVTSKELCFSYFVEQNDTAFPLTLHPDSSIHLNGGSIFSSSIDPHFPVNTTLPDGDSNHSLASSNVTINAIYSPRLRQVYTDVEVGEYGVGQEIYVSLKFYSDVKVTKANATNSSMESADDAFIRLNTTAYTFYWAEGRKHDVVAGQPMNYSHGSGTDTITFLYVVKPGDYSPALGFQYPSESVCIQLEGGYVFEDILGNTWDEITDCSFEDMLSDVAIDTSTPYPWRVTSSNSDGKYYPGDLIDVTVLFTKPVVILPDLNAEVLRYPQIELFVPHQKAPNLLAEYSSGNGTNEIHFLYVVPPPQLEIFYHPRIFLECAGTASLHQHLNGAQFRRASTNPTALVDTFIPAEDVSYLRKNRSIHLIFEVPRVLQVSAINASGVYTAGDMILLNISFSQPVMCLYPPVLRLNTGGAFHRDAHYHSGNNSNNLLYTYSVQVGDSTERLDYVDTRLPPFSTNLPASFALKTDIIPGPTGRLTELEEGGTGRFNDIIIYPYEVYGGVFRMSDNALVPAELNLPLPGAAGSLSSNSNIQLDTSRPNVTKIFTTVPDGSYGPGVVIPVFVRFNQRVVVFGSPAILFYISGKDKYAQYGGLSGTSDLLFKYEIQSSDQMILFDYKSRESFVQPYKLVPDLDEAYESIQGVVERFSQNPSIIANTTLAWVTYVESVISSTSLSGSGHNITVSGTTEAYPVNISIIDPESRPYRVGDIIDIVVKFSKAVRFEDDDSFILLNCPSPAVFVKQTDAQTALFRLTVTRDDVVESLTYPDIFSLRTSSSCSIVPDETDASPCAAQNLPEPRAMSEGGRLDALSSQNLSLTNDAVSPAGFSMTGLFFDEYDSPFEAVPSEVLNPQMFVLPPMSSSLLTGQKVQVLIPFSSAVDVVGRPILVLYVEGNIPFQLPFAGYYNAQTLVFEALVLNDFVGLSLGCTADSRILLNGGSIYFQTNFLHISPVDLDLGPICCYDSCDFTASFVDALPHVVRVYSAKSSTYFAPDEIEIYVEYSGDVIVMGTPALSLNLDGNKVAAYKDMKDNHTLTFGYVCETGDSTAGLDYSSSDALFFVNEDYNDGVYMSNVHTSLPVNNTLPQVGAVGSLGRENSIVIDSTRATNEDIVMSPLAPTAGEVMVLAYSYNREVVVIPSFELPNASSFYLEVVLTSQVFGTTETLQATYSHADGNTVFFSFLVTKDQLSGPVAVQSLTPVQTGDYNILDRETGVQAGPNVHSSVLSKQLGYIDNDTPYVLSVSSPNISQGFTWGIGDNIQIDITMSSPVAIVETPVLRLALAENQYGVAEFVPYLGLNACYTILRFEFVIEPGTAAYPLEYSAYEGENPLTGDLRRCVEGAVPTILADLTLAFPFTEGSLGYCCPVNIDSVAPYVKYLMPLKRAGLYGHNEEIVILVRFSKPVIVFGYPLLELDVGTGVAYANYTESFYERELLIDILDTDVFFVYKIGLDDQTTNLHHLNANSIILNGSSILQKTQNPVLQADVTLRDPLDHELSTGVVEQQWKFGYPAKVEVLIRDLYHTDPQQITVRLEHGSKAVELFDSCCKNGAIGRSAPFSRLGNNATVKEKDTGIGTDLLFSDTRAENIALNGVVNQSSTAFGAYATRAIDGKNSPYFGDLSVTETSSGDFEAWWQVHLPSGSTVQTINIWPRTPQKWVPAVVSVTLKAWDNFPRGRFKLEFSGVLDDDGVEQPVRTRFISMGASAEDVTRSIHEHGSLRQLKVARTTIYGEGQEKGFGHTYLLTFIRVELSEPVVSVVETEFVGGTDVIDGESVDNYLKFQLATKTKLESRGHAKQVDRVASFVGGVDGENSWLLPYWVMVFEETGTLPPVGLEDSKTKAVWKKEFSTIEKLEQIVLAEPLENVGYVKIQREGGGALSLAEVEVFEHRMNTLLWYDEGFPVAASTVTKPFQPLDSFDNAFGNVQVDGLWSLQISSTSNFTKGNIRGWEGSLGTVSDWVLIITDLAGTTRTHYQDLRAEVTAMPKYGQLVTTTTGTTSPYAEWRDAFELTEGGYIEVSPAMKRALGICNGVDTTGLNGARSGYNSYRYCPDSFGVGPSLTNRLTGDYPDKNQFLRNERALFYIPNRDYKGPDFFTYQIFSGPTVQHSSTVNGNEVTVHVRECRDNQEARVAGGVHSLCSCAASEDFIVGNWTDCQDKIQSICDPDSLYFESFFNLCLQCGGESAEDVRGVKAGCLSEIIRSVSFLVASRRCDTDPYYSCEDEIITKSGRESFNYLSLSSYPWNSPFLPMRQYAGDV